jgi:hypothetical protein
MAVNMNAWNSTIEHLRVRVGSAEKLLTMYSDSAEEQAKEVIALRVELQHLEQLDADLTALLAARGEVRS